MCPPLQECAAGRGGCTNSKIRLDTGRTVSRPRTTGSTVEAETVFIVSVKKGVPTNSPATPSVSAAALDDLDRPASAFADPLTEYRPDIGWFRGRR
jgi:hypothetical protein